MSILNDDDIAIKVENLYKIYKLYNSPVDRMKEALHWRGKKYHKDFYALNNINFEIKKGDCVGVLGTNGAGKSTLLKIITGVLTPTNGKVIINGKVSAILELGSGFNPEYTGLENIYFHCGIMGYETKKINDRIQHILDFADIGEFIHQPFKSYSSGMAARLAFAVAVTIEPDILIVDEALAVGDMFFQAKSMTKMKGLINNDKTTVLFVSHDIGSIKSICSKAILLQNGNLKMYDSVEKVTEAYFALRFEPATFKQQNLQCNDENVENYVLDSYVQHIDYSDSNFKKISNFQRIQNGKASFTNAVLLDENNTPIQDVMFRQTITLRCFLQTHEDIDKLLFGFHIRNLQGVDIMYDDSILQHKGSIKALANNKYIIDWKFNVYLQTNNYVVSLVASIPIDIVSADVDMCDFVPIALQFRVATAIDKVYAAVFANSELIINKVICNNTGLNMENI